jgi:hypothetical protein
VRSTVVVEVDELLKELLELGDRVGLDELAGEPSLEGLLEAFDLAARGRGVRPGILLGDPAADEFGFEAVAVPGRRRTGS